MHEFSLMNTLVKQALKVSSENGQRRVIRVTLRIGALCQVVPESLELAFQALTLGTDAEGAELNWSQVEARVECEACRHVFQPEGVFWVCPRCEERACRVLEGNDLLLESVELSDACKPEGGPHED